MTEKAILEFINHLEELYEVDKWTIHGIHVWPLIRLNIGDKLLEEGIASCPKGRNILSGKINIIKRGIEELIDFLKLYIGDYHNNAKYSGEQILCIVHNGGRQIKIKEHGWFHQTVSPIYEELVAASKRVYCMEYIYNHGNNGKVMLPRGNKSKIINLDLLCYLIKYKILGPLSGHDNLPGVGDVINECEKKGIDRNVFNVRLRIHRLLAMRQYYLEKLKNSNVKLIVISDWRNTIEMALVMAAKKLGIKCIEVNHGYFGQECYTHFGWRKEPKTSYEVRPDYYWCWTKESTSRLNNELKNGKAIFGGPPQALAWQRGLKEHIESIDRNFEAVIPSEMKVIIFTLNPDIPYGEYPVWLLDVIKETSSCYYWLLRKHPRKKKNSGQDEICKLIEKYENVEWEYSSVAPLYQLLECADVHVTYNSSSIIEAEVMGLRTVVLSETFLGRFEGQVNRGNAAYAGSKEEMISLLERYGSAGRMGTLTENGIGELIKLTET